MKPVIMSACLLGVPCRFDGDSRPCQAAIDFAAHNDVVKVCPETMGGLQSPREPSEIDTTKHFVCVHGRDGSDRSAEFRRGASKVVDLARAKGCAVAVLKSKSPSCGSHAVYDGTFSSVLVAGAGVAAGALRQAGIRVIDEHQLAAGTQAIFAQSSQETPVLRTDRLFLRPLTPDDAPAVLAYSQDASVGPEAGWKPHETIDDSHFFINEIASAPHVFGIFSSDTESLIGSIGLVPCALRPANTDCLMLGYALGRAWWGQGYMTEAAREVLRYAFDDLQIPLVTCNCFTFNDRSRHVIERLGFQLEGCIRQASATPDGVFRDIYSYVLDADAYKAGRN